MRPYELDDAVDVIGHDDKFVQSDLVVDLSCFVPFLTHDVSRHIQHHHPIGDFPEQRHPAVRANGNEIQTGLGIIITL